MRLPVPPGGRIVVKIGTSSLVTPTGRPDRRRMDTLCGEIAEVRQTGRAVVLVSSGAIAAGMGPLGLAGRPSDIPTLQAAAAVGQGRLLAAYSQHLEEKGLVAAQLLLTRYDFMQRQQYLNARNALERLLTLGAVPVVNENDTVAVDEIRFGDNDRLAALVANLARAELLLLLTDTDGLHSSDPRTVPDAPILDEVDRITPELERIAGASGSDVGTGGMASKIAAAWVATFSGVNVVVANARHPSVISAAAAGEKVGTFFRAHPTRASARRLWIAFAQPPRGTVVVDDGARDAVVGAKKSLLAVGVFEVRGRFDPGDTVDIATRDGSVFARGLVRYSSEDLNGARGRTTGELSRGEVVHRDQLVILEA